MQWRDRTYRAIAIYLVLMIVVPWILSALGFVRLAEQYGTWQGTGFSAAMLCISLDALLAPGRLLFWLQRHELFSWFDPPLWNLQLVGGVAVLVSGIALALSIMEALGVLGLIPPVA